MYTYTVRFVSLNHSLPKENKIHVHVSIGYFMETFRRNSHSSCTFPQNGSTIHVFLLSCCSSGSFPLLWYCLFDTFESHCGHTRFRHTHIHLAAHHQLQEYYPYVQGTSLLSLWKNSSYNLTRFQR